MPGRILLTGATGYVGGRLLAALESLGEPVRCMTRHPENLLERVGPGTEVVCGDVLEPNTLAAALAGCKVAYYLVHSMKSSGDFVDQDRRAAHDFGQAARKAGVERILYLGGLGSEEELSSHLASRQEVGRVLSESGVATIELRASIIIGSGSLSFEMIRALVDRLPVMITPRWVGSRAQPIAIEDVIAYLLEARLIPLSGSRIFEIGGADQASYADIMLEYARQRGLKRRLIPVPLLTPRLSGLWLGLVTPVYAQVGRKLVESLKHDTVVTNDAALQAFDVRPRGLRDAIARSLVNEDLDFAQTRWSDALSSYGGPRSWGGVVFGSRLVDSRSAEVPVGPEQAFAPIRRIGGRNGWYFGTFLWRLRGFLDLLSGGPGLRRGRRDPEDTRPGETLDFWRVEAYERPYKLRLRAEMKVPGRAWLQFEVEPLARGSRIRQTAEFDPRGLFGLLYWYGIYPLHTVVFKGMLRQIAKRAVSEPRKGSAA
ncbi:MAG: SDR family oxidoreductase [Bryobacterales bacterium]|nr:SDR family oxidoreductase [Acidobacteriota bacterium]MCB9385964.1 SDR family oxidoreductase [Bryobacterales bacterium]